MSCYNIQKRKTKILQKYYILYFEFLIFFLICINADLEIIKNQRCLGNNDSEIHLVVQGYEKQKILNNSFSPLPYEVLVNGQKDNSCAKECNLNKYSGYEKNIILKFNQPILSCESMFKGSTNIISVDLSKFDASEVTSMLTMFFQCSNLKEINFGSIKTSSLVDMESLFEKCHELTSIDLSQFDTSKVTTMYAMFYYCEKLEKINFGKINTSSVENMRALFSKCNNLALIDLSYFDTSKVTTIAYMFAACNKLIYLDLSNFNN